MNNNLRGIRSISQKQSYKNSGIGTRHSSISTPNNNIHININLNVKKKSHCYHPQTITGKKINNFIEVTDSKNHPQIFNQPLQKNFNDITKSTAISKNKLLMTNKHLDLTKKEDKIIKKKTKDKIIPKTFTPEKLQKKTSQEKSIEKSKTGKKLAKKKQSKSMQNLKVFKQKSFTPLQNKKLQEFTSQQKDKIKSKSNSNSNSNSKEKEKSREKSGKKLKKNRSSSKNIVSFQNSGIKKLLVNEKQIVNKSDIVQNMRKSKKSLKNNKLVDKDLIKINEFMEEKKKNEEKKKKEKQGEPLSKGIKIKDELLKASREKNQIQSRIQTKQFCAHPSQNTRFEKIPIFFGQDDQNQSLHQSNKTIYNKTGTPSKLTPQKRAVHKRYPKYSMFDKFKNEELKKHELKQFFHKIIKIQSFWRGHCARKRLLHQISNINNVAGEKRRLIFQKRSEFWDDDDNNSIINLQLNQQTNNREFQPIKNLQNSLNYKTPQNSNYNSSSVPTEQIHTNHKKYESESGPQNFTSEIHEKNIDVDQSRRDIENKNPTQIKKSSQDNSFLMSQIEFLKRQIEQQNQKFHQLEKQNTELKENLKSVVYKEKIPQNSHNLELSNQNKFQNLNVKTIKSELKAQPNNNSTQETKKGSQKFRNLKIQTQNEDNQPNDLLKNQMNPTLKIVSPSNEYVQNLKRQLQTFESPSNRSLKSAQLTSLKSLEKAFRKKELTIDTSYEKSSIMYQQMLQNNIVSPRTYNFKKIELDQKYKKQKQEINLKFREAEKVLNYISEEIVPEQKAGDDESPQKVFSLDNKISGPNSRDFEHVTEKIKIVTNDNEKPDTKKSQSIKAQLTQQISKYQSSQFEINENSSGHSNFKKYWTEDIDQVHKRVLQISNKIDQALSSESQCLESLKSQQMKAYSSQNSNFYSLRSDQDGDNGLNLLKDKKQLYTKQKSQVKTINEQPQYTINQNFQNTKRTLKNEEIISNDSNLSSASDKSTRNLDLYNIHYPSSPSHSPSNSKKGRLESKAELQEEFQNSLDGNNSQVSQNKSGYSESSMMSSKKVQSKGFDTRLTFIKQYCIALCEFIRSEEDLKEKIISNISTPLKYDYFQYLKSYRTTLNNQHDTRYNSTQQEYFYPYFKMIKGAVTEKGLDQITMLRFDELYNQNYGNNNELTSQMQTTRKFFIQAIIDVFNESLDFERPGSVYGQPLPWLVQSRNLKNNQVKYLKEAEFIAKSTRKENEETQQNEEDQRLDKIFGIAIAKIIQWGSCLCGFIPEPVSFDGEEAQAVNIDEEQTNLVRETRLAYMLQKSLAEEEERMIDNTMQQLQVQLQIQQILFQELISQVVVEMIKMKRI